MIAADTSTWIGFLEGDAAEDIEILAKALGDWLIEMESGYWQRASRLRARVLAKKRKARLGDPLIAQSCIDARVSLITRDRDFRAFAESAALDLMVG